MYKKKTNRETSVRKGELERKRVSVNKNKRSGRRKKK